MGEGLQLLKTQLISKGVDLSMLEQLTAILISSSRLFQFWILLEGILAGKALDDLGEVVSSVEVLEEAAHGLELVFGEEDLVYSTAGGEVVAEFGEVWGHGEERLMRCEGGVGGRGADDEGDDGGLEMPGIVD